jgi:hypothetical protein
MNTTPLFYDQNGARSQLSDPVGATSKHSFMQRLPGRRGDAAM